MGTDATPAEIRVILRHMDPPETAREYALSKLSDDIYSVPNLRDAAVEITNEGTAAIEHRYVMKVTLEANGTTFRVEERAPDVESATNTVHDTLHRQIRDWKVESATNTVHDTLHRQIRDWKEEVYFERRKEVAAYKEGLLDEASKLPPDNKGGLIIRKESQEMKPMFVEDAAQHLEEIGLDFLFFLNAENQEYNVVYRRKDGGYGWIVPSYTGLEASDLAEGQ